MVDVEALMPRAAPLISSFNAGEFSESMVGRTDVKYYFNACKKIRNFQTMVQGPGRRRSGSRFTAAIKDELKRSWLVRFEFNVLQSYVLEFGDQYIRFFSNHGVVVDPSDPVNPLEVATPYTEADLINSDGTFALRFRQSNDVLYIMHRRFQTRKLIRTAAAAFNLQLYEPKGGPFKAIDPDNVVTVYIDNGEIGSSRNLTASAPIFKSGHIGGLFLIEQANTDDIKQWESGKSITTGDVRRSDGKNYTALNTATTGSIRPTHGVGAKYDGDNGVQWRYDDPGFGWVKITDIGGGGTTAICDVLSRIPDEAVGSGNATTRWAFGAWSDEYGWPDVIGFFKERLCFARDQEGWMSSPGDFDDMRTRDEHGLVTALSSVSFQIQADRANKIEWLASTDNALIVGTAGDEHAVTALTTSEPFGPDNKNVDLQTTYGSRSIEPERVGDSIIFVQRSGREVREMRSAESVEERWRSTDATIFAEHVTESGVLEMSFQQKPYPILWCRRADGQLIGFTVNSEQDVRGWHPHRIGGFDDSAQTEFAVVESITSVFAPDGSRNELWMIVRRHIDGQTHRYVEFMEKTFDTSAGDDPEDAFFVDSGLTLNNTISTTLTPGAGAATKGSTAVPFTAGSPVFVSGDVGRFIHYRYSVFNAVGKRVWKKAVAKITAFITDQQVECAINSPWPDLDEIPADGWRMTVTSVSGADHLEGQTVQLCVDGAAHPDRVVTGGAVSLDFPGSKIHLGLKCTAVLQPMPVEAGAADGTSQGKPKRAHRLGIRFIDTLGAKYGYDEDGEMDEVLTREPGMSMDEAPPLFTGMKVLAWPDGSREDLQLTIIQDQPLPCTVAALVPFMNTQDSR